MSSYIKQQSRNETENGRAHKLATFHGDVRLSSELIEFDWT